MLTEPEVRAKIEKIIEVNRAILTRDLTTVAEHPQARIERAVTLIRLNELYEVIEKERPIFKCEKTRGER